MVLFLFFECQSKKRWKKKKGNSGFLLIAFKLSCTSGMCLQNEVEDHSIPLIPVVHCTRCMVYGIQPRIQSFYVSGNK